MKNFSANPKEMITSLWRNNDLILASVKREILGRYRGSMLGLFWSFFTPLLMLLVYTFVFGVVFKARWGTESGSQTEFALILFAGLIVFNIFAECVNRAPSLIVSNANYVKKIIFPLEILPVVSLISALFHAAISFGVWILAHIFLFGKLHLTTVYLPAVLLPLLLWILGLSWALASLGVFLRDVAQFVGILTTVLMFVSPIFYPITSLPAAYQNIIYLNPLVSIIEQTRGILYFGSSPNFTALGAHWFFGFLAAWVGFFWFQRTRKGFADVL